MGEHANAKRDNQPVEVSTSEDFDEQRFVKKEGLFWPKSDEICFDSIKKDLPFLRKAINQCKKKGVCIQAGGNAGMYPVEVAKHFGRVYTFEPELLNYRCLVKNTEKLKGVKTHLAALGNSRARVALKGWPPNCGSYEVSGSGTIKQMMIDDLKLREVDFIQLDIQGSELNALMGAKETLERCSPLIMVEEGWGASVQNFLKTLGYTVVDSSTTKGRIRDTIYAKA